MQIKLCEMYKCGQVSNVEGCSPLFDLLLVFLWNSWFSKEKMPFSHFQLHKKEMYGYSLSYLFSQMSIVP